MGRGQPMASPVSRRKNAKRRCLNAAINANISVFLTPSRLPPFRQRALQPRDATEVMLTPPRDAAPLGPTVLQYLAFLKRKSPKSASVPSDFNKTLARLRAPLCSGSQTISVLNFGAQWLTPSPAARLAVPLRYPQESQTFPDGPVLHAESRRVGQTLPVSPFSPLPS